ncbi:transcriptional regulator with XRE-family HTH domain [Kaistia hirudinis]|uniref:Transcriptional regulator with XRE-family HTH domain n=1 Tax=Kaistia hirudinis TaxID=1293440 RepID=A0A840AKV0_9HYPH|nr:helix-turn-helix transcriptional regulator [Kaistia hirudinis]MBB3930949.1 transcriptional regulator with XRE-family HTH domain [Kaistia hirudinis]
MSNPIAQESARTLSSWDDDFLALLDDKDFRTAFAADHVRSWIATQIRALREQSPRKWTQAELAEKMGTRQSVISRLEDPDYGKITLATLFEIASALDVPLFVSFVGWSKWLKEMADVSREAAETESFDLASIRNERALEWVTRWQSQVTQTVSDTLFETLRHHLDVIHSGQSTRSSALSLNSMPIAYTHRPTPSTQLANSSWHRQAINEFLSEESGPPARISANELDFSRQDLPEGFPQMPYMQGPGE